MNNAGLTALPARWREAADDATRTIGIDKTARALALTQCADELEAALGGAAPKDGCRRCGHDSWELVSTSGGAMDRCTNCENMRWHKPVAPASQEDMESLVDALEASLTEATLGSGRDKELPKQLAIDAGTIIRRMRAILRSTPAAPKGGEDAVLVNRRDLQTYTLFPAANLIRIAEALEFADSHPRIAKEIRDMVAVSPGLLPATPAGGGGEDKLPGKLRCLASLLQQLNAQTAARAVVEAIDRLASTGSAPAPSAEDARLLACALAGAYAAMEMEPPSATASLMERYLGDSYPFAAAPTQEQQG